MYARIRVALNPTDELIRKKEEQKKERKKEKERRKKQKNERSEITGNERAREKIKERQRWISSFQLHFLTLCILCQIIRAISYFLKLIYIRLHIGD